MYVAGLLSAEDHRNMAYWYYGLADFKYETDPGEDHLQLFVYNTSIQECSRQ